MTGGLPITNENSGISILPRIVPAATTEFFLIMVPPLITE